MKLDKRLRILLYESDQGTISHVRQMLYEFGCRYIEKSSDVQHAQLLYEFFRPDICIIGTGGNEYLADGITLGEKIREKSAHIPIIFVAGQFTEYEYSRCRAIRPSSYLSRDLCRFSLYQAVDTALNSISLNETAKPVSPIHLYERCFFKVGEDYKSIAVKDIELFFAAHKVAYAKVGDRNYPTSTTLKVLEKHLGHLFIRTHKTYLVNINFLDSINLTSNSIDIRGKRLPIGYAHRKQFLSRMSLLR